MIVAGIDVGGARKGFHAVLLEGSRVVDQLNTSDPEALARWCLRAERIAIDAPCGWALPGERSRLCERQLAAQGVRCFATPTREAALASRLPGRGGKTTHPLGGAPLLEITALALSPGLGRGLAAGPPAG